MKNGLDPILNLPMIRGITKYAEYIDPLLSDYRGNPLIEALPPIFEPDEVIRKIGQLPNFDEHERELPASLRLHCVMRIADFVQPLSVHIDAEQRISRMIRQGYKARNPLHRDFTCRLRNVDLIMSENFIDQEIPWCSNASGFTIVGISGIGKTKTVERNLLLYPQIIIHSEYNRKNLPLYQVVWMKLECPHDGSTKSLCLNFFQVLDSLLHTNYFDKYKRHTENILISLMARMATLHCLGVLVIDEIQNLSESKSGGSNRMLNFFVQLVNSIGVPVLLIDTYKATYLLSGEFRKARRGTGHQGDLVMNRLQYDSQWDLLMKGLWRYQWTKHVAPLTEELKKVLYEESQGITDIAIKLYMMAQWRAITTGKEKITHTLIKSVAKDSLKLVRPALDALKQGNVEAIKRFGDIHFPIEELEKCFRQNQMVIQHPSIETSQYNEEVDLTKVTADISTWLVQVGIKPDIAEKNAKKVIEQYGFETAVSQLKQKAYEFSMQTDENKTNISKTIYRKDLNRIKQRKSDQQPKDLRLIVKAGQKKGLPTYETLLQANVIKSPKEFLG
jgi:hypothetical protein